MNLALSIGSKMEKNRKKTFLFVGPELNMQKTLVSMYSFTPMPLIYM